jgi:hypothetical protein
VLYPRARNVLSVVAGAASTRPSIKLRVAHGAHSVVHKALALADLVNESVHEAVEIGDTHLHGFTPWSDEDERLIASRLSL